MVRTVNFKPEGASSHLKVGMWNGRVKKKKSGGTNVPLRMKQILEGRGINTTNFEADMWITLANHDFASEKSIICTF